MNMGQRCIGGCLHAWWMAYHGTIYGGYDDHGGRRNSLATEVARLLPLEPGHLSGSVVWAVGAAFCAQRPLTDERREGARRGQELADAT